MRYYFIDILNQQGHIASFASNTNCINKLKKDSLKLVPDAQSINIDDGNMKINYVLT